jgi:hypothetical protein
MKTDYMNQMNLFFFLVLAIEKQQKLFHLKILKFFLANILLVKKKFEMNFNF